MSGRDEKPQKVKDVENEENWGEARDIYRNIGGWGDGILRENREEHFRAEYEEFARQAAVYGAVYRRAFEPTRPSRRTKLRQWLTNKLEFVFNFFSNGACTALFIASIANIVLVFLCVMNLFLTENYLLAVVGLLVCTPQAGVYISILKDEINNELR